MREVLAMVRATWYTERSYRVNMVLSFVSLLFVVVPLYFVANALQPVMRASIAAESGQYFSFLLVGIVVSSLISGCMSSLPNALATAIQRGTLEAYLGTPSPPALLFLGMSGYGVLWALLRATVAVAAGAALGAHISLRVLPAVGIALVLLVASHVALGFIGAALVIAFRTTGPMIGAVLALSSLLGGVYYPTRVMPHYLQEVSRLLPLSYGLRALRATALLGSSLADVRDDVLILTAYTAALLLAGALATSLALRQARRTGTLGQY